MSHAAAGKADVWVGHQTKISCTAELLLVTDYNTLFRKEFIDNDHSITQV